MIRARIHESIDDREVPFRSIRVMWICRRRFNVIMKRHNLTLGMNSVLSDGNLPVAQVATHPGSPAGAEISSTLRQQRDGSLDPEVRPPK